MRKPLTQLLRALQSGNAGEGLLVTAVADAFPTQLPLKPGASVDVDLKGEREPTLQTHVHEPELAVQIVEVEMQALALCLHHLAPVGLPIAPYGQCRAGFQHREDADQSFMDRVPFRDRSGKLL